MVGGVAKKGYKTLTLVSCGSPGTSGSWRGHTGSGTNEGYKTLTKKVVDHLAQVVPGEDMLVVVPMGNTRL